MADLALSLAGRRPRPDDITLFTQELSWMVGAGVPLGRAAGVFEEKTRVALDRALVLMEPAIILLISGGVGSLIYVVISAMMSVNDLFL